jgi:hypothetical protein
MDEGHHREEKRILANSLGLPQILLNGIDGQQ